MKEKRDHIDKQLQALMQHSREKAPEGFSHKLMKALPQQQPLSQRIYQPLLSKKAVAFVVSIFVVLAWVSNYHGSSSQSQETATWLQGYRLPEFSLPAAIDGSMLTVIMLAVFLLAVLDKFLKRRLNSD